MFKICMYLRENTCSNSKSTFLMFRQPNLNAWRVRRILKSYANPSPITVSNSPNPPCVQIRLCKHRKSAPLLKYKIHVTMQHLQYPTCIHTHLKAHTYTKKINDDNFKLYNYYVYIYVNHFSMTQKTTIKIINVAMSRQKLW